MFFKKPPFNKPFFWAFMSAFFFAIMGITTWATIPTLAWLFLIFGLISGIVGVFLPKQNDTLKSADAFGVRHQFNDARKEFVAAFKKAIRRLRSTTTQQAGGILVETMPEHKNAFDNFRPILRKVKGRSTERKFIAKWEKYYTEKDGKPYAAKYNAEHFGNDDQKARKQAIKDITCIITFVNKL